VGGYAFPDSESLGSSSVIAALRASLFCLRDKPGRSRGGQILNALAAGGKASRSVGYGTHVLFSCQAFIRHSWTLQCRQRGQVLPSGPSPSAGPPSPGPVLRAPASSRRCEGPLGPVFRALRESVYMYKQQQPHDKKFSAARMEGRTRRPSP